MNTPHIARTASTARAPWSIAIAPHQAALMIALSASFAVVSQFRLSSVPALPAASHSASARHAVFKQAQAAQVADAAIVVAPASIDTRYVALKDAQAEARDLTIVPAETASGRERFHQFKQRQAELRADGE